MRSLSVCLIALAMVVLLTIQPAAALPILRAPYVRAGPVWALNPSMQADFVFLQTNTSHLFAADSEALAVSFGPIGALSSSDTAAGSTFAFPGPAIAQTSSRALVCDRSFFVIDEIR